MRMPYGYAIIVHRTTNCVIGYTRCPKGRKRWVVDAFKFPEYWSVSDRTMEKLIQNGWMVVREENGRQYATATNEGWGAHLESLARHYTRYSRRWKETQERMGLGL